MKETGDIGKQSDNQEPLIPKKNFRPEVSKETTTGNKTNDYELVREIAALLYEKRNNEYNDR